MKVESALLILMAQDMDRAVSFYRDVLGAEVKLQTPHWSELSIGGANIALHSGGTGEFNATGLGLQVSDIDTACKEVEAGGGKIVSSPVERQDAGIKLAELADTEGNGFSFSQPMG